MNDNKLNDNESTNVSQRKWDAFFTSIALVTSLKSKDTNTKVGAVLVDKEQHIIGTGYNGFLAVSTMMLCLWIERANGHPRNIPMWFMPN